MSAESRLFAELAPGDTRYVAESGILRDHDGSVWIDRGATLSADEADAGHGGAEVRSEEGRVRVILRDGGRDARVGPGFKDRAAWARIHPENVEGGDTEAKAARKADAKAEEAKPEPKPTARAKAEDAEEADAKADAVKADAARATKIFGPAPTPTTHTRAKDSR